MVEDRSFSERPTCLGEIGPAPKVDRETVRLAHVAALGNARATRDLIRLVQPRVQAVIRIVLGSGCSDVEDVAQQAIIAFIQALAGFRGECEPSRFAARIAVRIAMAHRRRIRASLRRRDDLVDPDDVPSYSSASGLSILAERRRALVRELLEELPEEQSESLALRIILGWTLDEVSVTTGAPINTVRSRLRLAKEALRRRIEADPALSEMLQPEQDEP
jgi:RNA polymerase sigma-70 factor (ECF subfamily)